MSAVLLLPACSSPAQHPPTPRLQLVSQAAASTGPLVPSTDPSPQAHYPAAQHPAGLAAAAAAASAAGGARSGQARAPTATGRPRCSRHCSARGQTAAAAAGCQGRCLSLMGTQTAVRPGRGAGVELPACAPLYVCMRVYVAHDADREGAGSFAVVVCCFVVCCGLPTRLACPELQQHGEAQQAYACAR